MKLKILLTVLFCIIALSNLQSQTIPDSCWKLIWNHNPENGNYNPDSIIYNKCEYGDLVEIIRNTGRIPEEIFNDFYAKKWFVISIPIGALTLPIAPWDSIIEKTWNDFDTSFSILRKKCEELENTYGKFSLRKLNPDYLDSNHTGGRVWLIRFDKYVHIKNIVETLSSINDFTNVFYNDKSQLVTTNIPDSNIIEVNIYPNPATDYIEINLENTETGLRPVSKEIEIFDMLGNHPSLTLPASEEGTVRLDVSYLQPGIYFVRVGDEFLKFVKI